MKYAVEMGSGVMLYKPNFIKTCSAIPKLTVGGYKDTRHDDHIGLFFFSK
jgi:hypothetical protein